MSLAIKAPPPTTAELLIEMGVPLPRQPRQRCLRIVDNGHRAAEASAYDAMVAAAKTAMRDGDGKLKPPPRRPDVVPLTPGARVLQQEMRRGIVAKSRNGGLWSEAASQ